MDVSGDRINPSFISHEKAIWKGSHVARSLGDNNDHHGYQVVTSYPSLKG